MKSMPFQVSILIPTNVSSSTVSHSQLAPVSGAISETGGTPGSYTCKIPANAGIGENATEKMH